MEFSYRKQLLARFSWNFCWLCLFTSANTHLKLVQVLQQSFWLRSRNLCLNARPQRFSDCAVQASWLERCKNCLLQLQPLLWPKVLTNRAGAFNQRSQHFNDSSDCEDDRNRWKLDAKVYFSVSQLDITKLFSAVPDCLAIGAETLVAVCSNLNILSHMTCTPSQTFFESRFSLSYSTHFASNRKTDFSLASEVFERGFSSIVSVCDTWFYEWKIKKLNEK